MSEAQRVVRIYGCLLYCLVTIETHLPIIIKINKDENIHKQQSFCVIIDRQTDKIFTEQMFICGVICTKKIGAISQLGAEKITFPLNVVHIQTDGHTDRRTDFCFYRVALLLEKVFLKMRHFRVYPLWWFRHACMQIYNVSQTFT